MNATPLKIAFDAKRALLNTTGLGNYSRYVIATMALLYPKNQYLLYSPSAARESLKSRVEGFTGLPNVTTVLPRGGWRRAGSLWRSMEIPIQAAGDGVDVYHGLSNELPLNLKQTGIPSVVTIHDVIWRRIPQDYAWIDRHLYDFKYGRSARSASRIIAISQKTKEDVVNDFGVDPERIDVIYQSCDPAFSQHIDPTRREEIKAKYKLPERFILSVGTIQSRKNQLLAVKGLRGLPADVRLAIVGRRTRPYADEIDRYIASNHLTDRVMWLTDVPFADLPYLYALARCSSYTSRYEGFGLPVVESLSVGTPVIAATGSCLEEAGGKAAVYVGPDDVDAYIHEASRLVDDAYYHDRLAKEAPRQARRFDTKRMAEQTMATYQKAILSHIL
ncbi:MAG: glycosyltransferase family 4 protein [Bacteroidales bacterium]|nr:glycosyltransferase family 4 protein [Bacteroidales bacterium]